MTPDPVLLLAALERQAAVLAPVATRLSEAAGHPPIAPVDWGGPAACGFSELEGRLRARIRRADAAAEAALHGTRMAAARVRAGQLRG